MSNEALIKALKDALDMEEKGYKLYKDASANCKNDITKKTFAFLADNELLHIENIKKFYNTMNEKGELPELYYGKTDKHNENSPLAWAQAMCLVATVEG